FDEHLVDSDGGNPDDTLWAAVGRGPVWRRPAGSRRRRRARCRRHLRRWAGVTLSQLARQLTPEGILAAGLGKSGPPQLIGEEQQDERPECQESSSGCPH